MFLQVRVVLQAEVPLENLFVNEGHHDDERNILIDDLGLKRVRCFLAYKHHTELKLWLYTRKLRAQVSSLS